MPAFAGMTVGVSESPSFSMTHTTSGSISSRSAAGIDVGPRVPASNLVLVDVLNHLVQRRRESLVLFVVDALEHFQQQVVHHRPDLGESVAAALRHFDVADAQILCARAAADVLLLLQ